MLSSNACWQLPMMVVHLNNLDGIFPTFHRHFNEHHGFPNHQQLECLFYRLFRLIAKQQQQQHKKKKKKTPKPAFLVLCERNHRWPLTKGVGPRQSFCYRIYCFTIMRVFSWRRLAGGGSMEAISMGVVWCCAIGCFVSSSLFKYYIRVKSHTCDGVSNDRQLNRLVKRSFSSPTQETVKLHICDRNLSVPGHQWIVITKGTNMEMIPMRLTYLVSPKASLPLVNMSRVI